MEELDQDSLIITETKWHYLWNKMYIIRILFSYNIKKEI